MILVMLVSITTVVASDVDDSTTGANDNNLTVQNSVENTVVESENQEMINTGQDTGGDQEDTLSASSDEDVLSEMNFNQLSYDINYGGSYITLIDNYKYPGAYDNPVYIQSNDNFVLDGQGHTIDGNGKTSIFKIQSYVHNVTFKNIKFINSGKSAIIFDHTYDSNFNSFCNFFFKI